MRWFKRASLTALTLVFLTFLLGLCFVFFEGKREPGTRGHYVALGSSFAAGIGLGKRAPDSPFACQRSVNGYPQQLARMNGLLISDVTCSGATVSHTLHGGQYFQGPQVDVVGPQVELVTLTAGGNDVSYVGDLVAMSHRQRSRLAGFVVERFWDGALSIDERPFAQLKSDMTATLREIAHRAPKARIVVVTYPVILPPTGTCIQIGITESEATLMRNVGVRLADVTREAAQEANVYLVDMARISHGHDACSESPWVSGAAPEHGSPFHPNLAGAEMTARKIQFALNQSY